MRHGTTVAARLRRAAGLLVVLAAAGCSGEKFGTVAGEVTLDGKKVTGGSITFVSAAGGIPAAVFIQPDGTYRAEKVPAGDVLVGVVSPASDSGDSGQIIKKTGEKGPSGPPARPKTDPASVFPGRYADPGASGLRTTIKDGAETRFDVAMTK